VLAGQEEIVKLVEKSPVKSHNGLPLFIRQSLRIGPSLLRVDFNAFLLYHD
jgi:hypothetical protein